MTYRVITANEHIEAFLNAYLNDDEFDGLMTVLKYNPHIRPYWGKTVYKYIIKNHIYFLYKIYEQDQLIIIFGVKFNNQRKTFNFANTSTRIKTMKKWIENKYSGKF